MQLITVAPVVAYASASMRFSPRLLQSNAESILATGKG